MADYVASIHVPAGQTVWRADEVPHLTADALYRFEPEPDPMIAMGELRRFTSADLQSRKAGRVLNARELSQFARKCKAAGLPELPDGMPYLQWGEYLEAFNEDAQAREWCAGLIPPRDPHHAERLAWGIAAEEHRKLLRKLIASDEIPARLAGTLVPASPGSVSLQHLVLTREGLEQFAAMLAMSVADMPVPEVLSVALPTAELLPVAKKWTPERLEELRAYREAHGTKKAAEWAKVSGARVRELLPSDKPAKKGYSAFTHRSK